MYNVLIMAWLLSTPAMAAAESRPAIWPSDLNGDGRVTLSEMQATSRAMFLRADSDGDGRISSREWAMAAKNLRQKLADLGLKVGANPPQDRFLQVDTDRDGFVTASELDAAALRRFDRRDLNHDGAITFDEASRGDVFAVLP